MLRSFSWPNGLQRPWLLFAVVAMGFASALDASAQCTEPGVSIDSPPNPNIDPFPNQPVLTTSAPQPVTMKLTPGTGPLCITSIATTGDFAQSNNCGSLLPDGASCTINVTFIPTVLGLRTGTLVITAIFAGGSVTLPLSGNGVAAGPAPPQNIPTLSESMLILLSIILGISGIAWLRRKSIGGRR